ncbi:MAG: hypothetical protein AB8E82_00455 [Aureispira sp.]
MKDYKKSQEYYKKKNNDLYLKLKNHQATARKNAQQLGAFDFNKPESAKAEIYKVLDYWV